MPGPSRLRARSRLLRPLLVGVVVVLVSTACQADLDVRVAVEEDGSGQVEVTTVFDAEASSRVLDLGLDAEGLPLGDLAQSGWVVEPPETDAGGSTVVRATKAFGTADQFAEVMAELNGPDGPFTDFALTRTKRFARVDYAISGVVDTTGGFAAFGDAPLEVALGRPLEEIATYYGATPRDVTLGLDVVLPGEAQGASSNGVVRSGGDQTEASWQVSLADDEGTPIAVTSATRQVVARALRGLAVVAGVMAGLLVFARILRILLPDRRRRPPRRPISEVRSSARAAEPAPVGVSSDAVEHRWVALDGMGVLFREADDVSNVLIPFARRLGSNRSDTEIEARARWLRLGRITPAEFWEAIGVPGDADELDAAYLSTLQLSPGVIRYLRGLRERGLRLACITNEASAWATQLRVRHSLESLIEVWVVSGLVGVGKPETPIFEVLRRVTQDVPAAIVVIDDDLDVLDAARRLGYSTAWYAPSATFDDARGHPVIRSFETEADLVET